jgi:hypothetical protein
MATRKQGTKHTPAEPVEPTTEPPSTDAGQAPVSPDTEASDHGDQQKKWADPFGRHSIDLGDGRLLKLSRSNRWQQMRIEFIPTREGVDLRPSPEDTEFLKRNGFRWRADEKAWTRQLDKNSAEAPYGRANSDKAAEEAFVALANIIRAGNGLEPTGYPSRNEASQGI